MVFVLYSKLNSYYMGVFYLKKKKYEYIRNVRKEYVNTTRRNNTKNIFSIDEAWREKYL
jgi:hypothetical protein